MFQAWLKNKEMLKTVLIGVLLVGFVVVYWQLDGQNRLEGFAIKKSTMRADEFLQVFEINSREACTEKDRNKYALPEKECVQKLDRYSRMCRRETAEKFPGLVNTIEKMLLIGNDFTTCVFSQKEN